MSKRKPLKAILDALDDLGGGPGDVPINLSPQEAAMFADAPQDEEFGCPTDRVLPRCETTDKVSFPSKHSAKSALRLRQRRGAGFLRVYQCPHCHHHHLTSMRFEKS